MIMAPHSTENSDHSQQWKNEGFVPFVITPSGWWLIIPQCKKKVCFPVLLPLKCNEPVAGDRGDSHGKKDTMSIPPDPVSVVVSLVAVVVILMQEVERSKIAKTSSVLRMCWWRWMVNGNKGALVCVERDRNATVHRTAEGVRRRYGEKWDRSSEYTNRIFLRTTHRS